MSNHSNGRKKKRKLGDSKESSEASKSSGSIRLNEGAGQRGSVPSYSKLIGQKKLTASDGSGIKAQASNVMVQSNNRVEPVGGKRKRDEPNFPPSTKSPGAVSNPKPSGVFPASSVSNSHSAHRSTPSSGALKLAPTSSIEKSKQDKKRKYSESSSDSDSSSSSNNSTSASSSEDDSEAHKREKPVTKKHKMSRVKDDQSVKIGSNAAKAERERPKKIAQAKAAKAERERLEKIAQDKAAKAERERLVKQAAASEKARSKAFSSQMGTIQNSRRPNDKEIPNFEISKPDDWKTLSEKMKQGDNPAWMNVSLDFKYMKSVKKHSFSLNDKRHDPASQKSNLLYHDNREGDKSIFYSRDRLAKKGGGTLGSLIGYHDKRKSKEEANFLDTKESSLDSEIARNTLRVMRSETNLDSTLSESLLRPLRTKTSTQSRAYPIWDCSARCASVPCAKPLNAGATWRRFPNFIRCYIRSNTVNILKTR